MAFTQTAQVMPLQQLKPLVRLIINLYLTQVLFIVLTPLVLSNHPLALSLLPLFIAVQVLLGWQGTARMLNSPVLLTFLAGVVAQTPGIISTVVILWGICKGGATPDAFDFIVQIWYSFYAPLSTHLPRVQYHGVPLYFLAALLLPFLLTLMPMCGALIRLRLTRN